MWLIEFIYQRMYQKHGHREIQVVWLQMVRLIWTYWPLQEAGYPWLPLQALRGYPAIQ